MIMKFYNREEEIKELEFMSRKLPSMVVITGRRRIGKTEIIKEFLRDKDGIYLFVDNEKSEKMLLKEYTEYIRNFFGLENYIVIKDWESLLELIFDIAEKREVIVAFDEFQRFLQVNPSFINQLQKYWDINKRSKVFFILSGSSVGMMKKIFIEHKAPLFKRAQNILFLFPFDFKEISSILNDFGITDLNTKIEIYSLFGGTIYYYTLIEYYDIKNTEDILNKLILRKFAPLRSEVRDIIVEGFGKEHRTYYSILTAIALGKATKKEISDLVDVKETSLSAYLYDLITEQKPWKSKKGRYFLKDNFFKFWFRFIHRNMSYYELSEYDYLGRQIKSQFNSFVGKGYEEVCREFLLELNKKNKLPFKFTKIGSWWNRKGNEIDIVALNYETKEILFAECKWQEKKIGLDVLKKLEEKAKLVDFYKKERKEYFALFSKSGFKKELEEYAKENNLLIFDLDSLTKLLN
ncbi:MAG: ATP-binding protein [Methanosarcinales archaeon]